MRRHRRTARATVYLLALLSMLTAAPACALFFPGAAGNDPASGQGGQDSQRVLREQLDALHAAALEQGPEAKLQWAAYLSGVVGDRDTRARFGDDVRWGTLTSEAEAMLDGIVSGDDPALADAAATTRAQLSLAQGDGPAAVEAIAARHAAAPTFTTTMQTLWVHGQAKVPLEDPVAFCEESRPLAADDSQLYELMNACLAANPAASAMAEGLPWASKGDFEAYARVDAARAAEAQRRAAEADEAAARDAEARRERERQQAAAASSSSSSSSSSAPAGPVTVSFTLRNTCRESVRLFFGDKPKFGSGTYSSLGSNTSTSKQMREGDTIWIVDEGQNGLSSIMVSRNSRTIEITESCTGFMIR